MFIDRIRLARKLPVADEDPRRSGAGDVVEGIVSLAR
jgi:hypothetical protein